MDRETFRAVPSGGPRASSLALLKRCASLRDPGALPAFTGHSKTRVWEGNKNPPERRLGRVPLEAEMSIPVSGNRSTEPSANRMVLRHSAFHSCNGYLPACVDSCFSCERHVRGGRGVYSARFRVSIAIKQFFDIDEWFVQTRFNARPSHPSITVAFFF